MKMETSRKKYIVISKHLISNCCTRYAIMNSKHANNLYNDPERNNKIEKKRFSYEKLKCDQC